MQDNSVVHFLNGCRQRRGIFACFRQLARNGLARSRELRAWGYLRFLLARPRVHFRSNTMTCAHFGGDQIFAQVDASFSPLVHPAQVNSRWMTSIRFCDSCILAMRDLGGSLELKVVFATCVCLRGDLQLKLRKFKLQPLTSLFKLKADYSGHNDCLNLKLTVLWLLRYVNHAPVEVHTFLGQIFLFILHLLSFPLVTPL